MRKPKVAFICVHNSCRSQIAEALGKCLASDAFDSYSAGTDIDRSIDPDAVRMMKQLYHIDMELTQHPKSLEAIPHIDIIITMGCNVKCPCLPCEYREDWGLDDPAGKDDDEYSRVIKQIERKITALRKRIAMAR